MRALCFDIGGTSIKYSIVEDSKVLKVDSVKTPISNHYNDIPKLLLKIANQFKDFDYIGISSAGVIDIDNCRVVHAEQTIPNYIGANFKEVIEEELNIPVFVLNDVNAAVYGEYSARNDNSILMIALGTGVGGGYIEDDRILNGHYGAAMEIGHISILNNDETCYCGKKGCFEYKCSTIALLRDYEKQTGEIINGVEFFGLYKEQNEIAIEIYNEFIKNLGKGISNFVYIFNPEVIVIGGGISDVGEFFIKDIEKSVRSQINDYLGHDLRIEAASLKNDAALVGMYYYISLKISEKGA